MLNIYQFRFRSHDPQIGRFLEIDPLADKYVYNSTYSYAENKVINGIDLEGLEFVEKISSKNCTKQIDITIKVVNRSSDTKENIEKAAAASKAILEATFKGKTADGYTVNTVANVEVVEYNKIHWGTDLVMEVNDGKFRNGQTFKKDNAAGMTPRAQTENGLMEVMSPKAWKENFPQMSDNDAIQYAGEAQAHEVGHSGGLLDLHSTLIQHS